MGASVWTIHKLSLVQSQLNPARIAPAQSRAPPTSTLLRRCPPQCIRGAVSHTWLPLPFGHRWRRAVQSAGTKQSCHRPLLYDAAAPLSASAVLSLQHSLARAAITVETSATTFPHHRTVRAENPAALLLFLSFLSHRPTCRSFRPTPAPHLITRRCNLYVARIAFRYPLTRGRYPMAREIPGELSRMRSDTYSDRRS